MALRALNSNGQMGPIWPQMPLVARSSLPVVPKRRQHSASSGSSYSSQSTARSHSRCRSHSRRRRHRPRRRRHSHVRRPYSSRDSSCCSSSRSTSRSRSSSRSRSYRRDNSRRRRRRSTSGPRFFAHNGHSRRLSTRLRSSRDPSRRQRSDSCSGSCSSHSLSRSVIRKNQVNDSSPVRSGSNHPPPLDVNGSHR